MKKLLLIAILNTILLSAFGQNQNEIDSIQKLLQNQQLQDTSRVLLLIDLPSYYTSNDVNKSFPVLEEALQLSRKNNYLFGEGRTLLSIGECYVVKGELDKSLKYILDSEKIFQKLNDKKNLISVYNNLARIYNINSKHDKALEIHLKVLELVKNDPPSSVKAKMHFYTGTSYEYIKDLKNAEIQYKEALSIATEINFELGQSIAEGALANVYISKREYLKALELLEKTLKFSTKHNQKANIGACHIAFTTCYFNLKAFDKAFEHNQEAIKIYEELDNFKLQKQAYIDGYKILEAEKKYKNANEYLKKYFAINDSIFKADKMKVIEELQTKYESEKNEAQVISLSQQAEIKDLQIKQQKYIVFSLIGLVVLFLLGVYFLAKQTRLKEQQKITQLELEEAQKRLALEQQYRSSELKAIRSQMNPHFVFNALNSIQEYIVLNEKKLAGRYLGKFADLMRIYLNHSQVKFVTINEEVDALKLYLELEQLRFEDTLTSEVVIKDEIDEFDTKVPSLLVQPYVENALKHGLLHRKQNRKLKIQFYKEGDAVLCKIEDNGIGRVASAEINKLRRPNHTSFATGATQNRIELLNFNRKKPITVETIDLHSSDGSAAGTKVILTIPNETESNHEVLISEVSV